MKKLPVDVHDFEVLITGNHVYVDKTQYIHKMATEGTYYFLSRPRRFGKTLLVWTLEQLFKGNKELFKGLWIENTGLIIDVYEKHQRRIAILIDEYDQPLISHLGKGENELETAKQNREVLREFYGVLKGGNVGKALRFVFLTGISKFARVSIFSELNNLDDLSMQEPYSALLGYTDEELWRYFEPYIRQLSKRLKAPVEETLQDIRTWYNGYRFTDLEVKVYNPFSVAKLLKQGKFQNYWFDTATPAFLVDLIKEQQYPVPNIETLEIHVFNSLVEIQDTGVREQYRRLHQYLGRENYEPFIETANAIIAAIPYEHIRDQDEHYYHTVFYLMLAASGVLVPTKVLTAHGRIDMEVHFPNKIYIVEPKCNQSAEQAIAQIKAKKYFEKHLHGGRRVLLLGINYSTAERRITEYREEEVMES